MYNVLGAPDGEVLRAAPPGPEDVPRHPVAPVPPVPTRPPARRHTQEGHHGAVPGARPGEHPAFPVQGAAALRHDGPVGRTHAPRWVRGRVVAVVAVVVAVVVVVVVVVVVAAAVVVVNSEVL